MDALRGHWDKVYETKAESAVSWYQTHSALSLKLIRLASPGSTVAWIIMAPLIFAKARRYLPWRTQIIAFSVSGSSVAMGLKSKASN